MNVIVLNLYRWTKYKEECFQNSLVLLTLTPQAAIFEILDPASNDSIFKTQTTISEILDPASNDSIFTTNKVFINHILQIFEFYVYKSTKKVHKYK